MIALSDLLPASLRDMNGFWIESSGLPVPVPACASSTWALGPATWPSGSWHWGARCGALQQAGADHWDEDEHYWVADKAIAACAAVGLQATYAQVSSCGGVWVVKRLQ